MGGKGGGGMSAGPMLKYGDKALDLQKQIYETNKAQTEPYYRAGLSGLNELMMRMGLPYGSQYGSNANEIRNALLPKYTTAGATGGTAGGDSSTKYYYNPSAGLIRDENTLFGLIDRGESPDMSFWRPFGGGFGAGTGAVNKVDEAGLNAAVQAELDAMNAAKNNPLYGSLLKRFTLSDFEADPSYQFRMDEGQRALERQLSGRGQFAEYNPAAAKALTDWAQQAASQEYMNAYNRYNQDQGNIYNRLANITGMGQTATGQLAQIGQNYANAGTELFTGMGNAITAANAANQANKGSMFNSLLGLGMNIGLAPMTGGGSLFGSLAGSLFSDKRLKENIVPAGEENGHKVYEFNYRGGKTKFIGVMAQDLMETNPEAVTEIDGYLAVDYDAIGVKFREANHAA